MLGKRDKTQTSQQSLGPQKKSFCKFSQLLAIKHLSRIHISICPVAPPQRGKMKYHWGSRKNKCQAATLYKSYFNLSNGKQNAICTSSCRVVGMQLYNQGKQRPKWRALKTFNVETHVQINVGRVGVREGIELGWSQGFRLDELDVW